MSDDCCGGGDSGGFSNDYSCDTMASNDYSSNNDFVSNVACNDYSSNINTDIGSTLSTLENAMEYVNNVESTKAMFDDINSETNDDSSTRLQADQFSTDDKYIEMNKCMLNNYPIGDHIPTVGNYVRRNNYLRNTASNTNRTRTATPQTSTGRRSFYIILAAIVIPIVVMFIVYVTSANNHSSESTSKYRPIKIEPLPQGVYNTLNMNFSKFSSQLNV